MRPSRLEVEGFTVFRRPTVVDLDGVELFALVGPTGSGKSSLIDAMVFALYGSIPRLDRRAVAPIIALGASEAKVRLDFAVGAESFTAVRVVRRTRAGATTKEARLVRASDGEVLAGTADELTASVTDLLGLGYEHFVKCVVLPQGAFASFLHDSGADRQGLLIKLLDLGLYERMASVARQREAEARRSFDQLSGQLEALADATPAAVAAAEAELAAREALAAKADGWAAQLTELASDHQTAVAAAGAANDHVDLLASVQVPAGVAERSADLLAARAALDEAGAEHEAAVAASDAAAAARAVLADRSELERAAQAHEQLAAVGEARDTAEAAVASAEAAVANADRELAEAEAAMVDAAAALEAAQWRHRARDLAAHLVVGEACPVCEQEVAALPSAGPSGSDPVAAAREAAEQATSARDQARRRHSKAERDHVRADTELTQALSRVAGLEPLVAAWPDLAALRTAIDEVVAADEAVAATQAHARRARRAESEAQARVRELEGAQRDDLAAFDRVRDTVASLGPPAADRADLAAAWSALKAWVAERLPVARDAADAASARVEAARGQAQAIRSEAAAALAEHGLQLATGEDPARVAAAGTERSRAGLERLQRDAGRAADLRTQCHEAERSADLARALGQHLSARGFEKWVLDEALAELTVGATETLRTLSGGAYSLTLDDKSNFVVVDHRNADENRSARTLSGGETFLASLALALALADQVGSLASDGAARIESIFLDEGFGTLDADTLDVVAAAIEELGSRGRMVGLVSHVPELAERVPVRFEVRRDPAGSHVEKVVV